MILHLTNALERDCDLLLIRQFTINDKVQQLFLKKAGLENYIITDIYHSHHYLDENGKEGESDIVIKLTDGDKNIIVCIEDKINAIAMPNQYQRYKQRCEEEYIQNGYDNYYLFIFCSKKYYETNNEAKKYDYHVFYEELIDLLNEDHYYFDVELLNIAINKSKSYQVIEDEQNTLFWKELYNYIKNNYGDKRLKYNDNSDKAKGINSCWFSFLTNINGISIIAKMNKDYVDLTFNGMGNDYFKFKDFINSIDNNLHVEQTGKSCAIRFYNKHINMKDIFNNQIDNINDMLDKVSKCYDVIELLNKYGVNKSPFEISNR